MTGHTDSVLCLKFNHKYIVSGGDDSTIKVWSSKSFQCLKTMIGHEGAITCLQFDKGTDLSGFCS